MPKLKVQDYWNSVRKQIIESILNMIKDNGEILDEILISKMAVEPPYLNNNKAQEYLKNLKLAGKIEVDDKGMVSLCQ